MNEEFQRETKENREKQTGKERKKENCFEKREIFELPKKFEHIHSSLGNIVLQILSSCLFSFIS